MVRPLYLMFVRMAGWLALLARSSASKDAELLSDSGAGLAGSYFSLVPSPDRSATMSKRPDGSPAGP